MNKSLISPPPFQDFWTRLFTSLVLSFFFVFLGNASMEDFRAVTKGPFFITDIIAGFLLSFILISYISYLTVYLGKKYPWTKKFSTRFARQALLGVLVPSVFSFLFMYILLIGIDGLKKEEVSFFFEIEFPIIILIIILWNFIYIGYYYYYDSKKARKELDILKNELYVIKTLENKPLPEIYSEESDPPVKQASTYQKMKMFVAVSGNKNIPIPVEAIAYIYKNGNSSFLKTVSGEQYQFSHSLEEMMSLLNEDQFFRANRQFIISLKSCHYFTNEENGKLAISLLPPYNDEVFISQKRSSQFKEWLNK